MAEICFIEAKPRVIATGAETSVRLAGGGVDTEYYRGGQHFRAGLVEMPRFKAGFGFDDNGWSGGTVPTSGDLAFMPGDATLLTQLSAYYWREAAITVDAGDESAPLVRRLTGHVSEIAIADGVLSITLADPSKRLDKPLLGAGFAGTGGIEGPSEATGRAKRRSFGAVFNVELRLLDKVNNIYEAGDPSRPIEAFDAVRDKGRAGPMTLVAWQGSIAATFAALQGAVVAQGGCVVAPSIACVKWWTVPSGPLTADIRGENSGGYTDTAVGIAARLLAAVSGPTISSFATAEALRPATCGIHISAETDMVAQAIDRLFLGSSLFWILQPDATVRVGEWAWGASAATLDAIYLGRVRQLPPVKTRKVGYRRNHRVHGDGEISAAILAGDVTYLDGTPVEDLQPAEPGATDGAVVPTPGSGGTGNVKDETGVVRPASDLLNTSLVLSSAGLLEILRETGTRTPLGEVRAQAIGAATEGALRLQSDALERLAAVTTMIDTRLMATQEVLRDAGVYVDPTTGKVTISAIDATAERVNDVKITLDALSSTVSFMASTSYVDAAIAQAVIDPSQIPVFDGINARLTSAELRLDGIDATLLLKADATIVDAISASLTTAILDIDALEGTIVTKVDAVTFNALETRVATAENSLTALGDTAEIARGISVARLVDRRQEDIAAADLTAIISGDRGQREQVAALALAREEITTRLIDGDAAEAQARTVLAARVGTVEGAIVTEQNVRAGADTALAQSITNLTSTVTTETSNRQAAINAEANARISADGALGGLIDVVEAAISDEISNRQAAVTSEANARIGADDALANSISTVTANLTTETNQRIAAVSSEAGARTTADTALGGRIDTVEAAITSEAGTRAAAVTAEANARVSGDSALSSQISTVTTTVNGHTASINSVTSSVNGVQARYTLRLNVNDKVSGMVFGASSTTSTVDFVVDAFRVYNAGGTIGAAPFEIRSGAVYMKKALIEDLSVDTIKIAGNAITLPVSVEAGSAFVGPDDGEYNLLETSLLSIGTVGNPASVLLGFYATLRTYNPTGGGPDNAAEFKLYCDKNDGSGYQMVGLQAVGIEVTSGNAYYWIPVSMVDLVSGCVSAKFKVTAKAINGPQGRAARISLIGAPTLVVQGSKR